MVTTDCVVPLKVKVVLNCNNLVLNHSSLLFVLLCLSPKATFSTVVAIGNRYLFKINENYAVKSCTVSFVLSPQFCIN